MKFYFPKMISLFIVGTLMLSACGGGSGDEKAEEPTVDTTKPIITVTLPEENHEYGVGQPFYFSGTFDDETALKEVTFSLLSLKPASIANLKGATGLGHDSWVVNDDVRALTGKSKSYTNEPLFETKDSGIPSDVYSGNYKLTITCKDAAGNTATKEITVNFGSVEP